MATKKKVTIDVTVGTDAEMAEKAKQLAESVSSHTATLVQQAILEHYGPNSAEFAEAMRGE